ncbi:MAG TPA: hypothetical protein VG604_04370 [Candidatus Saccharimonadales bacterium]|nr:hypothetical protein [Candidatus Saccharimonadales bacterium]
MGKISALTSVFLISLGAFRLLLPGLTYAFVAIDWQVALLAIGVGSSTLLYQYGRLQNVNLAVVFQVAAILLGGAVLISTYTPTLGSLRVNYISVSDIILLTEAAVVTALAGLRTNHNAAPLGAYLSLLALMLTSSIKLTGVLPSSEPSYRRKLAH